MKTKNFIPATSAAHRDDKKTDYWGVLFVSFIFISSMSCFLFANNVSQPSNSNVSDATALQVDTTISSRQQSKS
ncbi:hypothetical protein [Marinomonas algarum]|uniref:Uncharacterized protein n=1 Tax=Marinomonas algarum TaxID=2883105 RepID=A0A9X1IKA3_9GAMM|nr:hypothetical protein [Marinomonas algarum]MCB5160822.1 hypothetical protein [Marinomonas algarum]